MMKRISGFALASVLAMGAYALAAGMPMTYNLAAQNGSGETGTVTLVPTADGTGTTITVKTKGQGTAPQPDHVHNGTCAKLGSIAWPLTTLQNGTSKTLLKGVTEAKLTSGKYAVNVHKSTSDLGTYVACVNLLPMKKM